MDRPILKEIEKGWVLEERTLLSAHDSSKCTKENMIKSQSFEIYLGLTECKWYQPAMG